jgi:hypothetical protein
MAAPVDYIAKDEKYAEHARIMKKLLDVWWDSNNMDEKISKKLADSSLNYFDTVVKVDWGPGKAD